MHISVVLQGVLRGMGRAVACSFVAVATSPTGRVAPVRYSDCSIITAPSDLPDGTYLLEFERRYTYIERRRGRWLVGSRPVKSLEDAQEQLAGKAPTQLGAGERTIGQNKPAANAVSSTKGSAA
jgi:hypothetical protein